VTLTHPVAVEIAEDEIPCGGGGFHLGADNDVSRLTLVAGDVNGDGIVTGSDADEQLGTMSDTLSTIG
jgi:hypothetical protein